MCIRDRVYAREPGAIAAPTAGLHFTQSLLKKIERVGVKIATLTLKVGTGTFQPVRVSEVAEHRMEPLRIEVFCGMVFGSFSKETPDVETYLSPRIAAFVKRNLDHPLKLLGTHSQIIHNNWKLYAENVRDSYHATLLHTFYATFKVNRLDMDGGIVLADNKWHHISYAKRHTFNEADEYTDTKVHSTQYESKLKGPEMLNAWDEFDDGITHSIQTIFPNIAIQFTLNSLAVRFFVPRGPDKTELFWHFLGYECDTEEQTRMRVMQGNLTGAAGLVALEDGCINEFVQRGIQGSGNRRGIVADDLVPCHAVPGCRDGLAEERTALVGGLGAGVREGDDGEADSIDARGGFFMIAMA